MRAITASVLSVLVLVCASAPAVGEPTRDPSPACSVSRGQTLEHILAQRFPPGSHPGPRTVILLVDPSPSLVRARFPELLERALAGYENPELRLGLSVVGDRKHPRVPVGPDRTKALTALRAVLVDPADGVRNVFAPIRTLARRLEKVKGAREILLVSTENGDGEDDLERTAELLVRSGAKLHVIGRPALLSDTYWVRNRASLARRGAAPPGDLDMRGQDGAYDDVPWGWVLQQYTAPGEFVSSGYGMFGLSRLVALSGGSYSLHAPLLSAGYRKCQFGRCRICGGQHADCGFRYMTHRLRDLAPSLVSRLERRRSLGRDALALAVLDVWGKASAHHVVYSRPPLRRGPGLLREEGRRIDSHGGLLARPDFPAVGKRAKKLAEVCAELSTELGRALDAEDVDAGAPRTRAVAECTRAYLLLTRLNLVLLSAYCERAAKWRDRPTDDVVPPEFPHPTLEPGRRRVIQVENVTFCHGGAAIREFDLPGLEEAGAVRDEAFAAVEALRTRYDGTPFGRVARLMGVAIFTVEDPRRARPLEPDVRHPRGAAGGRGGGGTSTGGR